MVERITVFQTSDGKRFDDPREAENYEYIYKRCQEIMGELRPATDFNEWQAVRQNIYAVKSAFRELMELCCKVLTNHKRVFIGVACGKYHRSQSEHILSDFSKDYPCLQKTFYRWRDNKAGVRGAQSVCLPCQERRQLRNVASQTGRRDHQNQL